MFDAYGGSAFPGIGDILYNINEQVKSDLPLLVHISHTNFNVQEPGTTEYNRLVKVLLRPISDNLYTTISETK